MHYDFKGWQELAWIIFVTTVVTGLGFLTELYPEKVTDWRVWTIMVLGAVARAVAGAVIAWFTRPRGS